MTANRFSFTLTSSVNGQYLPACEQGCISRWAAGYYAKTAREAGIP
jgi:hypothetical protein